MRSTRVERKKPDRKSKSELKKESGRWRPTTRQVFWAIGVVVTLITIALLVVQLYPGLWGDVSREPVAMLKGRVATLIGIGVALTVLIVLLTMGSASLGWTGFRGKTLWDLLQLLIVPLVLVGIGLLFEMQQADRQQAMEEQQRVLAEQRAQDEALQAYLDQMSHLLLEKDLLDSKEGSAVRTLARARTFAVMQRLDAEHNKTVARFLSESKLIEIDGTTISLLRGASLEHADLAGVDLRFADLSTADLQGANLHMASLKHANLSDVHLSRTTDLTNANLEAADLKNADMRGAKLTNAKLKLTDFSADLSSAFPDWTGLTNANLSSAFMVGANLHMASLKHANLTNADLSEANLTNARGVTQETLEKQAKDLEGATMPTGQILATVFEPAFAYEMGEDWDRPPETSDQVFSIYNFSQVRTGEYLPRLLFTHPSEVFDPSNPAEELPAPENAAAWVSWFQRHPNLDISKPVPVTVGGASGKRIDVTLSPTPENYSRDLCGKLACVPLYPISGGGIKSSEGWKYRFAIVDVGGETVLIEAAAPEHKFDKFIPKARKVLDTVEWNGGEARASSGEKR
jgi:uncharacterized protein YjbI with pentapeptide repeats